MTPSNVTRTSSGQTTISTSKPTSTSAISSPDRHQDSSVEDYRLYAAGCRSLGIELTQPQYNQLLRYAALLRDWNNRINIISRNDTARVLSYHAADSIAVQSLLPRSALVCDLGSGGGLPGIPLSIVRPDLSLILVESSGKRSLFLTTAIAALGLDRVRLINRRAEEHPCLNCDVVVSRLTGKIDEVLPAAAPHIRPGGCLILYKTTACQSELNRAAPRIARAGLTLSQVTDITLPFGNITRRFVVLRRTD